MPIRFHCAQCNTRMRVPDGAEGKRVKCPKCNYKQKVPGEKKTTPDIDLISIGDADPKDKSKPKKYTPPKPPKLDTENLIDDLKKVAPPEPPDDTPEEQPAPPKPFSASPAGAGSPPATSKPNPEKPTGDVTEAAPPDEPQPESDDAPDLEQHDDEPSHESDDLGALAAMNTADDDGADDVPDFAAPVSVAPPDDDQPEPAPHAEDQRVESTPALEAKPKAPPAAAPKPISLDEPKDEDDGNEMAQLFTVDDDEPDDEPPAASPRPLAGLASSPPPAYDPEPAVITPDEPPRAAPMFMGLLIVSYLLRFLGGVMLIVTCVVAVTDPFGVSANNLLAKVLAVIAGLAPALITWAIGEAVSALRHIARNSFR